MAEDTEQGRTTTPGDTSADLAYRALLAHATECSRCRFNWQICPTRRALAATLREARP